MLGENVTQADTKEPPSHTKGENDDMQTKEDNVGKEQEQYPTPEAQPITTIIIISQSKSSLATKRTDKGKKIATDDDESLKKLVKILMELNKKKAEQYMWTISNRLKLKPIIDVRIHPNSVGSRKFSGQAAGARNVSSQAAGARKASSQPSAA
ncbi:hypothetical protein Tco_0807358 [Tanacetum coccineum]